MLPYIYTLNTRKGMVQNESYFEKSKVENFAYSPFPEFTKTADAIESVSTNSDTKILSGKEKNSYIKLTEKSKVFKEVSGNSKLDKSTLVQEVTTQNNAFYSTLVIISGLKKHNKLTEY